MRRTMQAGLILALGVVAVLGIAGCVVMPVPVPVPTSVFDSWTSLTTSDEGADSAASDSVDSDTKASSGPLLDDVKKLPVDAQGGGELVGVAPGDADVSVGEDPSSAVGWFKVALDPAPQGLDPYTTVLVHVDGKTRFLVDGVDKGEVIDGLRNDDASLDPTSDGETLVVRFHIRNGDVWADTVNESKGDAWDSTGGTDQ